MDDFKIFKMKKKSLFWAGLLGAIAESIIIISSIMIGAKLVGNNNYWPDWFIFLAIITAVLTRFASEGFITGKEI